MRVLTEGGAHGGKYGGYGGGGGSYCDHCHRGEALAGHAGTPKPHHGEGRGGGRPELIRQGSMAGHGGGVGKEGVERGLESALAALHASHQWGGSPEHIRHIRHAAKNPFPMAELDDMADQRVRNANSIQTTLSQIQRVDSTDPGGLGMNLDVHHANVARRNKGNKGGNQGEEDLPGSVHSPTNGANGANGTSGRYKESKGEAMQAVAGGPMASLSPSNDLLASNIVAFNGASNGAFNGASNGVLHATSMNRDHLKAEMKARMQVRRRRRRGGRGGGE